MILLLAAISLHLIAISYAESEADILLEFKESLENAGPLSGWTNAKPPCSGDHENWVGVLCEKDKVWGLQLQNMGLEGMIDVDALAKLPNLRALSFMNNNLDGPLPNLTRLAGLKSIYLSNNQFSGEIQPDLFFGMPFLKKIYLANNKFSGAIPASLTLLTKLRELVLDHNNFVGEIPAFTQEGIVIFDVSHNGLIGLIPASLSKFSASAFEGNKELCGPPLRSCDVPQQPSIGTIIVVAIVVTAALAALVVVVIILRRRKQPPQPLIAAAETGAGSQPADLDKMEKGQCLSGSSAPEKSNRSSKKKASEMSVKITFLRDDRNKFDMSDLLKASAEILGSGVFGSTYKAALNDGEMMVVKRFRYMNNVNKEEFHEHMRRLGRLSHPNVLPIVGFYYRKEEKLLVTDYAEKVSLAVQLHGNRSRSRNCPDWPTRLKIVKGVGQGLLYLYSELPSLTAPHGHLKSSNVLLDGNFAPLLTDYALVPVVNQEYAQDHMISYKSPEYKQSGRITKKTDVWGLGILILEIMTGRFPANFLQQGSGNGEADIVSLVETAVNGGDGEVFDADMIRSERSEGEMMKMLRIGLSCCEVDVDLRYLHLYLKNTSLIWDELNVLNSYTDIPHAKLYNSQIAQLTIEFIILT
ncbi:probable LRR receptor-like serine/threonine-protein kinase rlk [Phtheirospermum japonicum]|uniref:Probable LRR receptor-like serine/threonine-protein kinase rlk n=1 Tax=Phtheirospermum japonicum TaxID=374723 RepID=A0A830AXK4_9LAMI|nr:probable LRR receptor-like serine/threonine-protein kinase rlk [Phtheirospermum japonicum]